VSGIELWEAYAEHRSDENRNQLVEHYLPLVKWHAQRVLARLPRSVEHDDLTSAGIFGLIEAIEAFDPARNTKFETYSMIRIRGAMLDELRRVGHTRSLHEVVLLDDVCDVEEFVHPKSEDPTRRIRRLEFLRWVTRGFSLRERLIVILCYYENQSVTQAADELGVSRSRAYQIYDDILQRWQHEKGKIQIPE
jgi:RNA polymerase sigma factor (sigma-70 family)